MRQNHRIAHVSTVGRRQINQDSYFTRRFKEGNSAVSILAVADGMGGLSSGEEASALAIAILKQRVKHVVRSLLDTKGPDIRDVVRELIGEINQEIYQLSVRKNDPSNIGTTLVFAIVFEDKVFVANVGDSRAYTLSPTTHPLQISNDHTVLQDAVDKGEKVNANDPMTKVYGDTLTRSLGEEHPPEVDFFYNNSIPEGGSLLLSSDGFHKFCPDEAMIQQLYSADSFEAGIERLASLAYHNNSDDNITIAALHLGDWKKVYSEPAVSGTTYTGYEEEKPENYHTIKNVKTVVRKPRRRRGLLAFSFLFLTIVFIGLLGLIYAFSEGYSLDDIYTKMKSKANSGLHYVSSIFESEPESKEPQQLEEKEEQPQIPSKSPEPQSNAENSSTQTRVVENTPVNPPKINTVKARIWIYLEAQKLQVISPAEDATTIEIDIVSTLDEEVIKNLDYSHSLGDARDHANKNKTVSLYPDNLSGEEILSLEVVDVDKVSQINVASLKENTIAISRGEYEKLKQSISLDLLSESDIGKIQIMY